MMKKNLLIMFLTLLIFNLSTFCSAKEVFLEQANIKVNIPNNYIIATQNDIPEKILKDFNVSPRELTKEFFDKNIIMYCYDTNTMTEFYFVYSVSNDSKKVKDYYFVNDIFSDTKFKNDFIQNFEKLQNCKVTNFSTRDTYDAKYIDIKSIPNITNAKYARTFLTIKNSASLGINGRSYNDNNIILDNSIEQILSSIKFINNNITKDNAKDNTKDIKSNIIEKSIYKGLTSGLSAFIVMIIFYVGKSIWNKRKHNSLPTNIKELSDDLNAMHVDVIYSNDLKNIFSKFQQSVSAELINDKALLYKQFEIELYNSIFNAGFVYRGILTDLGKTRYKIHNNFLNLCVYKGFFTQQEANNILNQLDEAIKYNG